MTALLNVLNICTAVIGGHPPADCIPPRPPIREMNLLITQYDPAIGGINCDSDCSHLSLVPMSDSLYGVAAACPAELVGLDFTAVISHPDIGTRYCLDRGSAVIVEYGLFGGRWQYVVRVDLLESGPHPLNYHLLSGWWMEWTAVSELVG